MIVTVLSNTCKSYYSKICMLPLHLKITNWICVFIYFTINILRVFENITCVAFFSSLIPANHFPSLIITHHYLYPHRCIRSLKLNRSLFSIYCYINLPIAAINCSHHQLRDCYHHQLLNRNHNCNCNRNCNRNRNRSIASIID